MRSHLAFLALAILPALSAAQTAEPAPPPLTAPVEVVAPAPVAPAPVPAAPAPEAAAPAVPAASAAAEPAPAAAGEPAAPPPGDAAPPPERKPDLRAKPRPRGPAKVAVLDFSLAGSAHPDLARVLGDAAARGAADDASVQVMSQGEIVALLGLERTKQMLGCTEDQGCLVELGSALDSDRLVSGSLTILERTALLTVRLLDARKARTLARTTATLVDATEAELVDAARRLSHEALTGKKMDTSGTLRIRVSVPGAGVTLDGKGLGQSPLPGTQRVLEGPHAIVVQKPGFVRWSSTVAVTAGADVPVDVDLVPIQLLSERARSRLWSWAYAATGVAVATTVGGFTFGKLADGAYDDYKAATTRSAAERFREDTKLRSTIANASWGIAAVSAAGAGWLFVSALREDARAAREAGAAAQTAAVVPVEGGAVLTVAGRF